MVSQEIEGLSLFKRMKALAINCIPASEYRTFTGPGHFYCI